MKLTCDRLAHDRLPTMETQAGARFTIPGPEFLAAAEESDVKYERAAERHYTALREPSQHKATAGAAAALVQQRERLACGAAAAKRAASEGTREALMN